MSDLEIEIRILLAQCYTMQETFDYDEKFRVTTEFNIDVAAFVISEFIKKKLEEK